MPWYGIGLPRNMPMNTEGPPSCTNDKILDSSLRLGLVGTAGLTVETMPVLRTTPLQPLNGMLVGT